MADLHNTQKYELVLDSSTSDNTALTTSAINMSGYRSLEILITSGTLADADATFAVEIQDSNNDVTYTAVADANLLGTEADVAFAYNEDNKLKNIGYIGSARYVKAVITPSNNASAAPFKVIAVKGNPMKV